MRPLLWSQACGPDTAQQHVMPTLVLLFFNTASAGGLSGWGLRTSAAACAVGKEKKLKVKTKMFEKRDLMLTETQVFRSWHSGSRVHIPKPVC